MNEEGELARLRAACAKENEDIGQMLGIALGYPYFSDDQTNFPGSTRSDGVCIGAHVAASLAAEAARRITEQAEEIRVLQMQLAASLAEVFTPKT